MKDFSLLDKGQVQYMTCTWNPLHAFVQVALLCEDGTSPQAGGVGKPSDIPFKRRGQQLGPGKYARWESSYGSPYRTKQVSTAGYIPLRTIAHALRLMTHRLRTITYTVH
jgi:hypothetical protein